MTTKRIVKDFDERKLEFLQATQEFFYTIGYQKMSVSKLTNRVGVAKGTFYHYFTSKEDLLTQWVIHEMMPLIQMHQTVAEDNNLTALEKLNQIMKQERDWDLQNLDLMLSLMTVMYDKNNILLLTEMNKQFSVYAEDLFSSIIKQGVAEGVFDTPYPTEIAKRVILLGQQYTEDFSLSLIKQMSSGQLDLERLLNINHIWEDIMVRILGAPQGSLTFLDQTFLENITHHLEQKQISKKIA